jgi:hypothetical protein
MVTKVAKPRRSLDWPGLATSVAMFQKTTYFLNELAKSCAAIALVVFTNFDSAIS